MTREKAVETLMGEWNAGEEYREFFTRMVDDYMGTANGVLLKDLEAIRILIRNFR